MTAPSPAEVTYLADHCYDVLGRLVEAYKAAHGDLYDLQGSAGAEGLDRRAGEHSDPVGNRFDDEQRSPTGLVNAYNALSSARFTLDRALFGHLSAYRHNKSSADHADSDPTAIMGHEFREALQYQAKRRATGQA